MDKNFVYTCVECRLSDMINKDTAKCKQGKFSDQLIVNRTQTALEVGSYQYISFKRPKLEYSDIVCDNCTQYEINTIERMQNINCYFTSANLLQNAAAKLCTAKKTPLLALHKPNFSPNFTYVSFTQCQGLVLTIIAFSFGFEHKHSR